MTVWLFAAHMDIKPNVLFQELVVCSCVYLHHGLRRQVARANVSNTMRCTRLYSTVVSTIDFDSIDLGSIPCTA